MLKKLSDLALSPALRGMPQRSDDHPEFLALVESIRDHGLFNPFIIDEKNQVMDGRHRLRACRKLGIRDVPCEVRDSSEAVSIALECLMARRHYSKGALAYTALPLLEKASEEGAARKLANLKKGQKPEKPLNGFSGEPILSAREMVAKKLGIGHSWLGLAKSVSDAFKVADEHLAKWLKVNGDAAEKWEAWNKEVANAWTAFRADYCEQHGLDAADGKSFVIIPESLREKYEAELFDGSKGLAEIAKSVQATIATKGQPRRDKSDDPADAWDTVSKRIKSLPQHLWAQWEVLDEGSQTRAALDFAQSAAQWPAAVQHYVAQQLKQLVKGGV